MIKHMNKNIEEIINWIESNVDIMLDEDKKELELKLSSFEQSIRKEERERMIKEVDNLDFELDTVFIDISYCDGYRKALEDVIKQLLTKQ